MLNLSKSLYLKQDLKLKKTLWKRIIFIILSFFLKKLPHYRWWVQTGIMPWHTPTTFRFAQKWGLLVRQPYRAEHSQAIPACPAVYPFARLRASFSFLSPCLVFRIMHSAAACLLPGYWWQHLYLCPSASRRSRCRSAHPVLILSLPVRSSCIVCSMGRTDLLS